MQEKQDHYALLGVPRTADSEKIRAAYKVKALELHPDKNPEGETIFKLVVNAYHVLRSPNKRREYDRATSFRDHRRPYPSGARSGMRPAPANGPAPQYGADRASRKSPKFTEEKLFEDIYKQYQRGTYGGSVPLGKDNKSGFSADGNQTSFAEWFKRKQEELRQAEEVFKAKLDYARQLEVEEQKRAAEWRNLQKKREREREAEMESARAQRERESELLRREKENAMRIRRAEEEKLKMAAYTEVQNKQQEELDRHLRELAVKKQELDEERRRLASEREEARRASKEQQRVRQQQRELEIAQEVKRAEAKLEEALAHKADYEAYKEREQRRRSEEQAHALEEESQRQKNLHEEESRRQASAEEEEARLKASQELDGKRRAVLEQIVEERKRHQSDVEAMRRETDRIEAEMQAKLDALREAKRSGQPINLDEWKL